MKKVLLNLLIFVATPLTFILVAYQLARLFAPGSYPYAELYELDVPEDDVIKAVELLKIRHPNLSPPLDLVDGRRSSTDYWYDIYLFDTAHNHIYYAWTRPEKKSVTTMAFVSVSKDVSFGNWMLVNKEFTSKQNREAISRFESLFLDSIKGTIRSSSLDSSKLE
ncbi:hypothetical protein [Pseudocnuella soli]|uniref:hypothetical protein n=1 Tax=Pseudocnuella soli TaxID=2502779 RepID=UPI0010478297|nr:hypothetical protein [Pseudocnuella soli]